MLERQFDKQCVIANGSAKRKLQWRAKQQDTSRAVVTSSKLSASRSIISSCTHFSGAVPAHSPEASGGKSEMLSRMSSADDDEWSSEGVEE
eukprot:3933021-Rhodomonas_salina.2